MSRILLARHGETTLNRDLRYSGQLASPVTALGVEQERRLQARLLDAAISRVISSDIPPCSGLADRVASSRDLTAEHSSALREASFGDWEGLTYGEAMARDRQAMVAFNRDTAHVAPPGGESFADLAARARPLFDRLAREHRDREGALLLVSHGGTLRALLCSLLPLPLDRFWTLRIDAASLTILDLYPMGPILEVLNDTCHLRGVAA